MLLREYKFTDYYHQFVTIEVDELTDSLKDNIKVTNEDCYALCSSYCGRDGLLEFNVLAIGPSWEKCTKGLRLKKMLGIFTMDQVFDCEARIADPDMRMIEKNEDFINEMDEGWSEELIQTRLDGRLDDIRDIFYPDVVYTGIIKNNYIMEYPMRITGIKGPFLVGLLDEEPDEKSGLHYDDPIYALPYLQEDSCRLFALFVGEDLSDDEIQIRDKIIDEMNKHGISFNGISIRS